MRPGNSSDQEKTTLPRVLDRAGLGKGAFRYRIFCPVFFQSARKLSNPLSVSG